MMSACQSLWVCVCMCKSVAECEAERNECLSLRLGEPYFIYALDVVFHHCLCPLSMYRLSVPISCLSKSIAWENQKKKTRISNNNNKDTS